MQVLERGRRKAKNIFDRFKRKIEVESLWIYVAHILSKGPKSVSEIRAALREIHGITVPTITLYSVIYRMEKEGLVKRKEEEPTKYMLTDYGELMFKKSLLLLEERILLLKQ